MSFEQGTATDIGDLLVKWFNFLQANGWTADVDWVSSSQSPLFGVIHRQTSPNEADETSVNLFCSFIVALTDVTDGPTMNMIPMRDYSSGNPQNAVEVATSTSAYRQISGATHIQTNFPTDPFENYWFFESDYYAHAVVEYATGFFRHFGMGQLSKIGKWIGGEYYYGHFWDQSGVADSEIYRFHNAAMDPVTDLAEQSAKMYGKQMNGDPFPNLVGRQSPESKWHGFVFDGDNGVGVGEDADGRDVGGLGGNGGRGGYHAPLYWIGVAPFNGYRPMHPIQVFTFTSNTNPDDVIPLGIQPDVRSITMQGDLLPGDEFTVGGDTWIAFPLCRRKDPKVADNTEQSKLFGLAYKKVLT